MKVCLDFNTFVGEEEGTFAQLKLSLCDYELTNIMFLPFPMILYGLLQDNVTPCTEKGQMYPILSSKRFYNINKHSLLYIYI